MDWLPKNTGELIDEKFRGWTKKTFVPAIIEIVNRLEEYWPLTVRQVHYQLVSGLVIENNRNNYSKVSTCLTKLRRLGIVPWYATTDRHRKLIEKRGYEDLNVYLKEYIDGFFDGYDRCLVQNQENYVEIFTEKDGLAPIIQEVAWIYCVRIVVCAGQLSSKFLQSYANRAKRAIDQGKHPVILHFGDLDPTGARIPYSIARDLTNTTASPPRRDCHSVALKGYHVEEFNLPHSVDALKNKDPNYEWYVKNFGTLAVELDALEPKTLQQLVEGALTRYLDTEDMLMQQEIERKERKVMKRIKQGLMEVFRQEGLSI